MSKTKMTVGQAVVKFLNQQYIEFDGVEQPFVDGIFTIFGHGMVVGLGQALDEDPGRLRVYQGRNEQGMAHAAISYAKQHNRRKNQDQHRPLFSLFGLDGLRSWLAVRLRIDVFVFLFPHPNHLSSANYVCLIPSPLGKEKSLTF